VTKDAATVITIIKRIATTGVMALAFFRLFMFSPVM
jgi:hypothetical protein